MNTNFYSLWSDSTGIRTIGVARIFDWGGPNPQKFGCLHRNWEWFFSRNQKFERFFRPKSGDLQKKKKVFADIERGFSAETVSFTVTLLFNYCYVRNYWKKLQLNIVRLCCHNFLSLVEFWLGGARAPWAPPWLRLWFEPTFTVSVPDDPSTRSMIS